MIDEKKLIEVLARNSIFEKITNYEGKTVFDIIREQPKINEWTNDFIMPCICGRKPKVVTDGSRCDKHYEVVCECGMGVRDDGKDWSTFYATEMQAIIAWNNKISKMEDQMR